MVKEKTRGRESMLLKTEAGRTVTDGRTKKVVANVHLQEAVGRVVPRTRLVFTEVDLGTNVGECNCVPAREGDVYVMATMAGKAHATRFATNRTTVATQWVTVVLERTDASTPYTLTDARYGRMRPPEPADESAFIGHPDAVNARAAAATFWANNVLVLGSEPICCSRAGCRVVIAADDVKQALHDGQIICTSCRAVEPES